MRLAARVSLALLTPSRARQESVVGVVPAVVPVREARPGSDANVDDPLPRRCELPVAPGRVFGELLGRLHLCDGLRIAGWAQDLAHPDGPVCLDIVVDGAAVAIADAEIYSADSEAAGIGDGHHAFDLQLLLAPEAAHTVEVRRSADGAVVGTLQIQDTIAAAA